MDPESKKLLDETLSLAKDNNNILRSMRRSMRISQIVSFIYWIIIIGSAVGAYYFIHPYIDEIIKIYANVGSVLKNFKP